MSRCFLAVLTAALLVLPLGATPQDEGTAAEQVIDRAIAAQGGPAQVARLQAVTFKAKGSLLQGKEIVTYSGTFDVRYPDCYRAEMIAERNGRTVRLIKLIKDNRGFLRVNYDLTLLSAPMLHAEQARLRRGHRDTLLPLKDKDHQLRLLPPTEVAGRKVAVVEVASPGQPTEAYFFDEQTGLLVKSQSTAPDAAGAMRTSEMHFSNYTEADGVRYPARAVTYTDGKKSGELEIMVLTPGVTHSSALWVGPPLPSWEARPGNSKATRTGAN